MKNTTDPHAPADLLASAEALLDGRFRIAAAVRARSAALLARQALEQALRELWQARAPGVERCSVRAQIQCLAAFVGVEPAVAAATAWNRLSEACHHHPYAAAPSAAELRSWLESVRVFCEEVASAERRPPDRLAAAAVPEIEGPNA